MSSIYGIVTHPVVPAEVLRQQLASMAAVYEPDPLAVQEQWVADGLAIGVGGLRSPLGARLAVSADAGAAAAVGGFVYGWNGQVVPDPPERVLASIAGGGQPDPRAPRGSYQIVAADARRREAWLWNDRLGQRLLYVYQDAESIVFSSRIKAILAIRRSGCDRDDHGIADYLNYGYPLGDRTFFTQVRLLLPGTLLHIHDGQVRRSRPHAAFVYREAPAEDMKPWIDEIEGIYPEVMRRQAAGYTHHLVTLTGGLDSRFTLGHAVRLGLKPQCFTHGQRSCREYQLAAQVAAAAGVTHRLVEIDPHWMIDHAREFVRLTSGMCYLQPATLLGIAEQYDLPRDETCFLNAIFGGPINFGSGYFNRRDLAGFDGDEEQEIQAILRALFVSGRSEHYWQGFHPDFRPLVRARLTESVREELARHRAAGPHFYQKKDSFFIHNRLLRFMNTVDVNRHRWHDHFALSDEALLDFYLRLPPAWKLDRRFLKEYVKTVFPALARVPYKATGVSLFEVESPRRKERQQRLRRLRYLFERGTFGRLRLYDPELYYHSNQWFRKHERIRDFFRDLLLDDRVEARGYLSRPYLEELLAREARGGDFIWQLMKLASFELFCREFLDSL